MDISTIPFFFSFFYGVLSIISPCVVVLLPAYLTTITGLSTEELRTTDDSHTFRRQILSNATGFVLGFFLIFIPLGALIGVAAEAIGSAREIIAVVAGAVVFLLGLNFVYPLSFLRWMNGEARIHWKPHQRTFIGNLFFGATFAFVWTPCIGPFLLGVVALVSQTGNIGSGIASFSLYSLGLAVALLTFTLFYSRIIEATQFIKKHHRMVTMVSAALLMLIGVLMITNQLYLTNVYINRALNDFQPESWFSK